MSPQQKKRTHCMQNPPNGGVRQLRDLPAQDQRPAEAAAEVVTHDICLTLREDPEVAERWPTKRAAIRTYKDSARELFHSAGGKQWTPGVWCIIQRETEEMLSLTTWPRRSRQTCRASR